jgi:hypothetical protein
MQTTSPKFDPNSPEIKAYRNELAHQFVREGTMVAFPTCLPGMTTPIIHDESRITALDINADGHIYGGTSGRQAHLFGAAFRGLTGVVLDAGTVALATSTAAVCCRPSGGAIAFVNGAQGGRAVSVPHLDLQQDWIQEWGHKPVSLIDLGECVAGEAIVHAVVAPVGNVIVGVTARHLFTVDFLTERITVVGEASGRGRLVVNRGRVFGQDDGARLWSFDPVSNDIRRNAVCLPDGDWTVPLTWARDRHTGLVFTADATGRLFSFDEDKGFHSLGKAHLAPVGPIAVTADGRIFGFCGTEMANLFCCDPASGGATNLGIAASVLEQRRYGYQFGDAVTGPDGEIVFGEADNGGHLWLYFPKIDSPGPGNSTRLGATGRVKQRCR